MNLSELFNKQYQEKKEFNHLSLNDFFSSVVAPRISISSRVLDLGCGTKSLFENYEYENVVALDFSSIAIEYAKSNGAQKINYREFDFREDWNKDEFLKGEFDLIFDSHSIHCIDNADDRDKVFLNIKNHLSENGFFGGEMMISPGSSNLVVPHKFCPSAYSLEQEIIRHGFKIHYFVVTKMFWMESSGVQADIVRVLFRK